MGSGPALDVAARVAPAPYFYCFIYCFKQFRQLAQRLQCNILQDVYEMLFLYIFFILKERTCNTL